MANKGQCRVCKIMSRLDVYPMIEQQQTSQWETENKVLYFLMDSFSELTDQKFTQKVKDGLFVHIMILIIILTLKVTLIISLLSLNEIEISYSLFFEWIEENFPSRSYFFHFSKLDARGQKSKSRNSNYAENKQTKQFIKNFLLR